jgi:hypothetical protein
MFGCSKGNSCRWMSNCLANGGRFTFMRKGLLGATSLGCTYFLSFPWGSGSSSGHSYMMCSMT